MHIDKITNKPVGFHEMILKDENDIFKITDAISN